MITNHAHNEDSRLICINAINEDNGLIYINAIDEGADKFILIPLMKVQINLCKCD